MFYPQNVVPISPFLVDRGTRMLKENMLLVANWCEFDLTMPHWNQPGHWLRSTCIYYLLSELH